MSKFLRSRHIPLDPKESSALNRELTLDSKDAAEQGAAICKLRKQKGLSLEELAYRLGIDSKQLADFEKGSRVLPDFLIARLSDLLS